MIEQLEIREGIEGLTPARINTLYRRAPLLRAVDSPERVWAKFERSSLVLTAWNGGDLVGIARVLTDGVEQSYLCDLAVEPDVQGFGVGRALIERVLEECRGTEILAKDISLASRYYERLGFERADGAWKRRIR